MNLYEIILGQVPEAIYFALFLIFTKELKGVKSKIFLVLMPIIYVLILNLLPFSIWCHILYFGVTYAILRLLYKNESRITDVFVMGIASVILMLISGLCFWIIAFTIKNIIVCIIIAKLLLFMFLFITKNKLPKLQNMYNYMWNRNDRLPKPIKSATFRCINVTVFNSMFFAISSYILYYLVGRC